MEIQGRLIYFDGDAELRKMTEKLRRDIVPFPYNTPAYEVVEGITNLKTKKGNIALQIFGEHNLQNLHAARLACKQIGVTEEQFNNAIADFPGASNRLQKIHETNNSVAFKDFAHSPSKLKATVHAVRQQYPEKKLVACMELHTYSSLTDAFLPQYEGCMEEADMAFVYFNPEVIKHKKLNSINTEEVRKAFGGNNISVFNDRVSLETRLRNLEYNNCALLLMTSGNFSGINLVDFSKELLK
jgi:UDP-N-acetylmuramate: L-alanyl-gamma-D-glutamyl-meso-diaminopimelate ligase